MFKYPISIQTDALSSCFSDIGTDGRSISIPPLTAKCRLAPDKRCRAVPAGEIEHPWDYVLPVDDPVWSRFELEPKKWGLGNALYKTLHWKREGEICTFEIHARADFDGDGTFALMTAGAKFRVGAKSLDAFKFFPKTWDPEQPGSTPSIERPMLPH